MPIPGLKKKPNLTFMKEVSMDWRCILRNYSCFVCASNHISPWGERRSSPLRDLSLEPPSRRLVEIADPISWFCCSETGRWQGFGCAMPMTAIIFPRSAPKMFVANGKSSKSPEAPLPTFRMDKWQVRRQLGVGILFQIRTVSLFLIAS